MRDTSMTLHEELYVEEQYQKEEYILLKKKTIHQKLLT